SRAARSRPSTWRVSWIRAEIIRRAYAAALRAVVPRGRFSRNCHLDEGSMRRLIVCADGTWNKPDEDDHGTPSPTNVVKIQRAIKAIADDGTSQITFYHSGVGTG